MSIASIRLRVLIIFCALDHLILVICTLGGCKPYEQISSALWGLEQDGKFMGRMFRPLVDFVFAIGQSDHCRKVWSVEQRQIVLIGAMTP